MDKEENIRIIDDTLNIIDNGFYYFEGEKKELKLNKRKMKKCLVFLPEGVEEKRRRRKKAAKEKEEYNYQIKDMDSFSLAKREAEEGREKILILNMADALIPGGNVREGISGQEQDLCRSSTLLKSLESGMAKEYYEYGRRLKSFLYSDAMIISPNVEVFKDRRGNPLEESFTVSVISCAFPNLKKQPLSKPGYENIIERRIEGLLTIAENLEYKNLILGAWGCGAFGGDPETVSRIFRKELDTFFSFASAIFAIPNKNGTNYSEFAKKFPAAE